VFLAARNLVRAAEIAAESSIERTLADNLKDVRDLLEHWDENMPVFNTRPRGAPPRLSGKRFAERNPKATPYWATTWNSINGPLLFPTGPSAAELHNALDQVEASVTRRRPELIRFIPERTDQPWLGDDWGNDRWFPKSINTPSAPD
jgi:hypothetical protein